MTYYNHVMYPHIHVAITKDRDSTIKYSNADTLSAHRPTYRLRIIMSTTQCVVLIVLIHVMYFVMSYQEVFTIHQHGPLIKEGKPPHLV